MTPPTEHRLYPVILKQVLWGESEDKVRKRLMVNEVPEELSEAIYTAAYRERLRILRERSRDHLIKGSFALLVGIAVIAAFKIKTGGMHLGVMAGVSVFVLAGLFYLVKGGLNYLMAPSFTGSIDLSE